MIVNYERNPQYSLYYIGAQILKYLRTSEYAIDVLYEHIKDEYKGELSITYFYLALDWLYLINVIKIIDNKVVRCYEN